MEDVLIMLIVFQAVFMAIGYFALARQVESTRKRVELLGGMAAVIPILAILLAILPNGITTQEMISFIEFYVYSAIANAVTGGFVELVEQMFLGGR